MPSAPELRVILHIGAAKCGSSAIQAYLAQNADALANRGVFVPGPELEFDTHITGEQIWFFEGVATGGPKLGHRMAHLLREAQAKHASTLIISAENICNHPSLAAPMAEALTGHDCKIVFYVRRQDDFLISSWQQWNLKRFDTVDEFLRARAGIDACWLDMILPWACAFGDDRICVRPFVRSELANGDVVDDFFCGNGIGTGRFTAAQTKCEPIL